MSSKYNYFWGFESPFSQWHPALFEINGKKFISAEHAMMCWKLAMFEGDMSNSWLYKLDAEFDENIIKKDLTVKFSKEELELISNFRIKNISSHEICCDRRMGRLWSSIQAKIKRSGRLISNYNDKVFADQRVKMLVVINKAKFSQNEDLLRKMLSSGGNFVEASKFDKIYGIGMTKEEIIAKGENPRDWKGLNILGDALNLVYQKLSSGKIE